MSPGRLFHVDYTAEATEASTSTSVTVRKRRGGVSVRSLAADVSRWTGNDARVLEFTVTEVATRGHDEPVLADILRDGSTVAGSRAWLAAQIRKRKS
jgi:hypothetical protein